MPKTKFSWAGTPLHRHARGEERRATAYHESGHAVVAELLPHADPVHKVTIMPRGWALGVTWQLPEYDK